MAQLRGWGAALGRNSQAGLQGPYDPRYGNPSDPYNVNTNPYAFFNWFGKPGQSDAYGGGNQYTALFNPNPQITGALRAQGVADEGARERGALLGLESHGGAALPGGYGVAALQSQLGAQSDLSRTLGEANLAELERGQQFKQDTYANLLSGAMQRAAGDQGFQNEKQLQDRQNKAAKQQAGIGAIGGLVGVGGGLIAKHFGLAGGGFTPGQPTDVTVGEHGAELVIPHEVLALGPDAAALYARHALTMGPPAPGGAATEGGLGGTDASPSFRAPDLPTPYPLPAHPQPHGWLGELGSVMPSGIPISGREPAYLAVLSGIVNGLGAAGRAKNATAEQGYEAEKERIGKLNDYQKARYDKELDAWVAGAKNKQIMIPGVPYPVDMTSPVAQKYLEGLGGLSKPTTEPTPYKIKGIPATREEMVKYLTNPKEGGATAAAALDLNDYTKTYTDSQGNQTPYVDLSEIPDKKVKQAVSDLARKAKVPALADASPLKAIDSAHGQLESMGQMASGLEPKNTLGRIGYAVANPVQKLLQAGDRAEKLGRWKTARQTIVPLIQGLAAAGKGNRIMQSEIGLAQSGLPDENDIQGIGTGKLEETRKHLDNVAYALLGKKPPAGAAGGTQATAAGATHVYDPTTGSIAPVTR